ncbi:hypothetical protein V8017_12515 [Stenotrophomonas rhizophila]
MDENTKPSALCRTLVVLLGIVVMLFGLVLLVGGVRLAQLGGSWYFLLMGAASLVAGGLLALRRPLGALLYGVAFVATVAWALADAGLEFWPLVSRLVMPAVLAMLVALTWPVLRRSRGQRPGRAAYGVATLLLVGLLGTAVSAFQPRPVVTAQGASPAVMPVAKGSEQRDWQHWGNTTAGTRFAALDQITPANITQLQVAWTAHTGDVPQSDGFGAEDQNTPLQIGDTLYLCTPHNQVVALDVDSGKQRWAFDPKATAPNWQRCRGLGYFDAGQPLVGAPTVAAAPSPAAPATVAAATAPALCEKRILMTSIDARLFALDATTGAPCPDFGEGGVVDLKRGMGEIKPGFYTLTAAPLVAGELVIVGGRVADNIEVNEPSGVVRAYNVRSGALALGLGPVPGNPGRAAGSVHPLHPRHPERVDLDGL